MIWKGSSGLCGVKMRGSMGKESTTGSKGDYKGYNFKIGSKDTPLEN